MKLNRLEAHDRYEYLIKDQSVTVQQGADDCLKKNSFSLAYQERSPYVYVYGHGRTTDDGLNKRLIWEPRLSKPIPTQNSYLFRAKSKTDLLEICWILPPIEFWGEYRKGNIIDSSIIGWSISQLLHNSKQLGAPMPDDLPEEVAKKILMEIINEKRQEIALKKRQIIMPKILEAS